MRKFQAVLMGLFLLVGLPVAWVACKLGRPQIAVMIWFAPIRSRFLRAWAFKGYQPAGHDVFVPTYAKSGTNWMLQITHQIATLGQGEFGHIHDVVPWPDVPLRIKAKLDDGGWQASPTGKRVIKTHLAANYIPYHPDAKYVVVIRDPKDVLVSGYFFAMGLMPTFVDMSLSMWADMIADGFQPTDSWAEHTASYWAWRDRDNVLVFTFNQLKQDLRRCVQQVADLMGVELAEEQLALVVEKSGFAYMKAHEPQFEPLNMLPFISTRSKMIRSGKVGESKALLPPEKLALIDEINQAKLAQLGSDFPYRAYFMAPEPVDKV